MVVPGGPQPHLQTVTGKRRKSLWKTLFMRMKRAMNCFGKYCSPIIKRPKRNSSAKFFWETLEEALQELPENQRNVFVWNELEGETLQAISDRTGVNIKTLISRKRYATQHLRKRLHTLYEEFLDFGVAIQHGVFFDKN